MGKVLVFRGAKGGAGVTTIASNFAIALKEQSRQEVALVDFNLELGDTAVVLGLKPSYTITDALKNSSRLDQDFVSTLLAEHGSGVRVLTAPEEYGNLPDIKNGTMSKVLYILRERFSYVVVDVGPSLGSAGDAVFEMADQIYLVTQVDIPSLRNARRLISHIQKPLGERTTGCRALRWF